MLGVDHAATRILAGDREHALLEYLTVVPYYFWGAYNIHEMNSSTNVTRHPDIDDEKKSPARVFTANNTPSIVNSFDNLPMPTEDFVRNFGRRMHHLAMAVIDGHVADEKNVDYVVRQLAEMGTPFLAHVVGECKDDPNLKQIFSKSSPYSLLITEYIERCHNYEGFFTRDNVAALDRGGRRRRALRARAGLRLKTARPVLTHAGDRPAEASSSVEDRLGVRISHRRAGVRELALGVVMVHEQAERRQRTGVRVLEHLRVAGGVACGEDRPDPDVALDVDRLRRALVGRAQQRRLTHQDDLPVASLER